MVTLFWIFVGFVVFPILIGVLASFAKMFVFPILLGGFSYFIGWGFWPGCIIGGIISIIKLIKNPDEMISDVNYTSSSKSSSYSDEDSSTNTSSCSGQCRFYEYGCGSGRCGLSNSEREHDYCPWEGYGSGCCDHHRD